MDLKINLATKTYVNFFYLNLGIIGILAFLSVIFFTLGSLIASRAAEMNSLRSQFATLEPKKPVGVNEQDLKRVQEKIRFANKIIVRKTFDWLSLLDKLETVVPDGVAVTSLEPDPNSGGIRLGGVAKDFSGVQKLVETMEGSPSFREVYLQNHASTRVGQTQQGFTFQITCKVTT